MSVRAPIANSLSLDNLFRVATVGQQIMTEFNGAVSDEAKTMTIIKIILNLMKQSGH
jgi:hypothetical protein